MNANGRTREVGTLAQGRVWQAVPKSTDKMPNANDPNDSNASNDPNG